MRVEDTCNHWHTAAEENEAIGLTDKMEGRKIKEDARGIRKEKVTKLSMKNGLTPDKSKYFQFNL